MNEIKKDMPNISKKIPNYFYGSQISKINMTNTSQIYKFTIFFYGSQIAKIKYDKYFTNSKPYIKLKH
jgi:hypothetical protein